MPTQRTKHSSAASTGGLDAERIIEAALSIIDELGLPGLTMRRLGAALGVDAMAIYWHFDGKAALLDAVVEHEAQRLRSVSGPFPSDPIEVFVVLGRHYRRVLLEHPNLAPLLASRPLPQEDAPALLTTGAHILRSAGMADADIPLAMEAFALFAFGYVLQETGTERRRAELGQSFRVQQQALLDQVRAQPGDTSVEEAIITNRLQPGPRDVAFETGLRALLHGLRLGLGQPPG